MSRYEKNRIISIITARGGSKGIPNKNIVPLNGRPLMDYTITASLKSRFITETYVTSDCDNILSMADRLGARLIKRPAELASDSARSESAMIHALQYLELQTGTMPEITVLLQPTSPLRDADDIDHAFELFFSSNADALISGTEPDVNPLKQMLVGSDGMLKTLTEDRMAPFKARQLLPRAFAPNGAIYIIKTSIFLQTGILLTDNTVPFYMDKAKSLDVDTLADMEEAGRLLDKKDKIFKGEMIRI